MELRPRARSLLLVLSMLAASWPGAAGAVGAEPLRSGVVPAAGELHIDYTEPPSAAEDARVREVIGEIETDAPQPSSRILDNLSSGDDYVIEYVDTLPADEEAVFEAVMEEWAGSVRMNGGEIHVRVHYEALGPSALAAAGNRSVTVVRDGVLQTVTTAILNAEAGIDLYPGTEDINVYINSDRTFNTQLSGAIPFSEYSLFAVLLHEIGHGLGFSSRVYPGTTSSSIFSSYDQRLYHDSSSEPAAPVSPVRTTTTPTLETGRAWFLNLDGTWERIYDPASYQSGSSMSHLNEATYGGVAGAFMTPALSNGETHYDVDNVVLGVLEATGWSVIPPPAAASIGDVTVTDTEVQVDVEPSTTAAGPPAVDFSVALLTEDDTTIASETVSATARSVAMARPLDPGTYTVEVTATGSGGSSDLTDATVVVEEAPDPVDDPPDPVDEPPTDDPDDPVDPIDGEEPTTFVPVCPTDPHPFVDVPVSSFAAADVSCLVGLGITTGTSATTFDPAGVVTREQMAAFLGRTVRALGLVCPTDPHPFVDVPVSSFAAADVSCLVGLGITTGTSATTFDPAGVVTREQMAAFLGRTVRALGLVCPTDPHPFVDVPVSSFAAADVSCLVGLGITTGTSATTFDPAGVVTREQMAAFLGRTIRSF